MALACPCSSTPPETSKGVITCSFLEVDWDCSANDRDVRAGGWPGSSLTFPTAAISPILGADLDETQGLICQIFQNHKLQFDSMKKKSEN